MKSGERTRLACWRLRPRSRELLLTLLNILFNEALNSAHEARALPRVSAKIDRMAAKRSPDGFPYKTYLNILHSPLELIDVQKLVDACTDKWWNQTLCKVNDAVVRLGIVEGEYHWHSHQELDEFFYVIDGHLLIDLEDRVVDLKPRQGFVVPREAKHRTRAPERTVILMVERADIIPTGD